MAGIGRGGRGAALLQALDTPVRKPGQQTAQEPKQPQWSQQQQVAAHSQPRQTVQGNGHHGADPFSGVGNGQQATSELPLGRGQYAQLGVGRGLPRLRSNGATKGTTGVPTEAVQKLKIQEESSSSSMASSVTSSMTSLTSSASSKASSKASSASSKASSWSRGSLSGSMASPSIDEPKRGVSGQNLQLAVNYIPIQQQTGGVYQYAVAFAPEVESRGIRSAMVNEHTDVIGKVKAFDGCQLFLPIRLPQVKTEFTSKRLTDGVLITITVTLVKVLEADQCVQLYNIIFRRVMRHLKMQQVGRNYFDATRPIKIPQHKLELWPGYVTAIQHYEGGLLLVTDVSHRTLRTDTVLDVMYEMYQKYPKNFQEEVARHLIGRVVLTRYNNRTYRIDDIAWDLNPQCTFQCHDGSEVRFMDYYKKQYNLSIGDTEQPLLVNKPKPKLKPRGKHDPPKAVAESQKICLIPELSCMTGLTDDTRADFRAMKDIASHTRLTPADRISALRKFIENINSCKEAKAELENWGIKIHPDVLKVTGRQLQGEKILLKSRNFICGHEADWSREIMKEHMITAVPLQNWILGFTKKDQKNAMEFVKMLQQVGPPMGMPIKEPMLLEMKDDRIETFVRSIRDNCTPEVQLVVVVQPTSRDDRYAAIKKLCCVEKPVPSQVINGRTITQPQKLKAITQKIALQINCKLGGELWALEIPLKNMMVVGIDVYHETSHKGRSVGGFVASVNS